MTAVALSAAERLEGLIKDVRALISSEPEPTIYRLSPAGVLVRRDARREAGWPEPHWIVVDVPAGAVHHHVGQLLPDAAVDGWSPLVRSWPPIPGESR